MSSTESKNLTFKKINIEEIDERIMSWFKDENLMQFYTNSKSEITKEKLIESIKKGEEDGNNYTYCIYDKTTSLCIGTLKIGTINLTHMISDLVILIGDKNYHGKGLAIEAIQHGNQIAFSQHGIRKLYGGMYASNSSSVKAYVRSGWVIEGVLHGHYLNDGMNEDRIEVGCFNPKYFDAEYMHKSEYMSLEQYLETYAK